MTLEQLNSMTSQEAYQWFETTCSASNATGDHLYGSGACSLSSTRNPDRRELRPRERALLAVARVNPQRPLVATPREDCHTARQHTQALVGPGSIAH